MRPPGKDRFTLIMTLPSSFGFKRRPNGFPSQRRIVLLCDLWLSFVISCYIKCFRNLTIILLNL